MIFTLFLSPIHNTFSDDVDDPSQSKDFRRYFGDSKFNILYHKIEKFTLASSATRTISYANYTALTDWPIIIARVVGSARINTVGVDTDGSTAITGKLPIYGTSIFPGIGSISSYNVTSFTVESLADGTEIELYAAISAEDDDTRLNDNA